MRKIRWIILAVLISAQAGAQDALFSQQYLLPTLINPAAAGNGNDFRGGLNYRNQWGAVAQPFNSVAASFDTRLTRNQRSKKKNGLGVGLNFLRDKAGDPELTTVLVEAQVAYRVQLTANSTLSGGLSTAFDQRSVNPSEGKWASQFNGVFYDPSIVSGESFAGDSESHLDLGAGMIYEMQKKPVGRNKKLPFLLQAGLSAYHLGRVSLSDSQLLTQEIGVRVTGFAHAQIGLNEMMAVVPAVFGHYQNGSSKVVAGAYFKQVLVSGNTFIKEINQSSMMIGAFYEPSRAVIIKGLVEWGNYTIGLAYDIDISDVADYGSSARAFELNLIYQWNRKK
ncbi:MAG: type IX secretion system PorP/SprF family membrane protein [Cryomorphaceae bacterium]